MLSTKALKDYFSKLPDDFVFLIGKSEVSCNKQSISCFSDVIKKELEENPKTNKFSLPSNFSPNAVEWIVNFLKYQSLALDESLIYDIYLISAILNITILKKIFRKPFFSLLNNNNFTEALNILQRNHNFWDPLVEYIDNNTNYFQIDDFINLSHEFLYEIFSKTQIFSNITEDDKLKYINNYYLSYPMSENQNNSHNNQKYPEKLFLYQCLDFSKLSENALISICESQNAAAISKSVLLFPFLNQLSTENYKYHSQVQTLRDQYNMKLTLKDNIINSPISEEKINIILQKELDNFKDKQRQYDAIIEKLQYIIACINMLYFPFLQVKQIINSVNELILILIHLNDMIELLNNPKEVKKKSPNALDLSHFSNLTKTLNTHCNGIIDCLPSLSNIHKIEELLLKMSDEYFTH